MNLKQSIVLCAAASFTWFAQAASFSGFDVTTNGSAQVLSSGELQLTPASYFEVGSAFISTPFAFGGPASFLATFDFSMLDGPSGSTSADGFTFMVQGTDANALGPAGGHLGYVGISPSIAAAFRTWGFQKIEIAQDGVLDAGPSTPVNLESVTGTATVSYDGLSQLFSVSATTSNGDFATLSNTVDLTSLGNSVYFGFSAGTGASYSDQRISNFSLTVTPVPEPATYALMLAGIGGLGFFARRKQS